MSEYKVQFEVFEGPLDLLLYLIKKEEVDIYAVNLTKLATQFIEYIELMRQFDLEIAGEFLVMASTLMYIKSRELLPVDQQAVLEGERTKAKTRAGNSSASSSNTKNSRTPPRSCRRSKSARKMCFRACRAKSNLKPPSRADETGGRHFRSAERRQHRSQTFSGKSRQLARNLRGQMDRQRKDRVCPQDHRRARRCEIFRAV